MGTPDIQQPLFLAPSIPGEVPLFGPAYLPVPDAAYDGAELVEAPELIEDQAPEPDRADRQREVVAARHAELVEHRRGCGNCIPGARPCKAGRAAEKAARDAQSVLVGIVSGAL